MNLTKGENKPKKDPCPKNKKNTKKHTKKQEEIVVVEEEKNKKRIQYSCVLDLWLQNCIVIDVFVRFIYVIYAWENIGFMIAKLYCHRRFCKIHLCNLCLRKHVSYWPLLREINIALPFPHFKSTFTFSETLFSYEIQYQTNWMYDGAFRRFTMFKWWSPGFSIIWSQNVTEKLSIACHVMWSDQLNVSFLFIILFVNFYNFHLQEILWFTAFVF